MVKYEDGKIYKLVCNITGSIYIGSTCDTLSRRLVGHRTAYKTFLNGKGCNITSFKILENNDYDIVLIEFFKCDTKEELHKRERYFIELLDCVNKFIPGRSNKEYHIDNKDKISEKQKIYYKDNMTVIKEYMKEYSKTYHIDNKDKINERQIIYNKINRDKIKNYTIEHKENKKLYDKTRYKIKITCSCGAEIAKAIQNMHFKSSAHQKFILEQAALLDNEEA